MKGIKRIFLFGLAAALLTVSALAAGDCHTMAQDWFGNQSTDTAVLDTALPAQTADSLEALLTDYFSLRGDSFTGRTAGTRLSAGADAQLKADTAQRPQEIQALAQRINARILDADVHSQVLSAQETEEGILLTVYEWTFFDYDDLADGPGGRDTAGYGTTHTMTFSLDAQGEPVLVSDVYSDEDVMNTTEGSQAPGRQSTLRTSGYYSGYDPIQAIIYADTYVSPNPPVDEEDTSYYNPEYYDFNGQGGDCTNFTSQCIHAGGIPTDSDWAPYTYAWVNAYYSEEYFAANHGKKVRQATAGDIYPGSVLYLDRRRDESYHHSVFCVGTNSAGTPIINCHTSDRYHMPWDYSGEEITTVQLTSYRMSELVMEDGFVLVTSPQTLPIYGFFRDASPSGQLVCAAGDTITCRGHLTCEGTDWFILEQKGTLTYTPAREGLLLTDSSGIAFTLSGDSATTNDLLSGQISLSGLVSATLYSTDGAGTQRSYPMTVSGLSASCSVDLAPYAPGAATFYVAATAADGTRTSRTLSRTIAEATTASGGCGPDARWSLDKKSGVLTISGTGQVNQGDWARFSFSTVLIDRRITALPVSLFSGCQTATVYGPEAVAAPLATALKADFREIGYFLDVLPEHWAFSLVNETVERKLFQGTEDNLFSPDDTMTRCMFVTVLGRMAGVDVSQYTESPFTDLIPGEYYVGYVAWAAEKGIVTGTTETTFEPDSPVTREQAAALIARYLDYLQAELPKKAATPQFADTAQMEEYALKHITHMRITGLMEGDPDGYFRPKNALIRSEAAALMLRTAKALEALEPPSVESTQDTGVG